MDEMQRGGRFAPALLASFTLHAVAFVLGWQFTMAAPVPQKPEPLKIEFAGIITQRQMVATFVKAQDAPKPPQPEPPKPEERRKKKPPKAKRPPVRERLQLAKAPSAVQFQAPPEEPSVEPPAEAPPVASPEPQQGMESTENRVQQTISGIEEQEREANRRYFAYLMRKIKPRMTYPPDGNDALGYPRLAFFINADGSIQPGTLVIRKSSGHAVLDNHAMRVVRDAAPFEPPPKPMMISLEAAFTARKW